MPAPTHDLIRSIPFGTAVAAAVLSQALCPSLIAPGEEPLIELQRGDRICLMGNALAERMQHHGWLETLIQDRLPTLELSFRNLGFSADELTIHQRTKGFGSWDDHLARCEADVIFAFFGWNESFAGEAGVAGFEKDLGAFITHTLDQKYNGASAPRLVLFSPIAFEDHHSPDLPDGQAHNARLAPYRDVMASVAEERKVPFVDLMGPMQERYSSTSSPLTMNGLHLTAAGNRALAEVIDRSLFRRCRAAAWDEEELSGIRNLVVRKNLLWFNRYRATDGYNVYGGRSSLSYEEGLSNYQVLQRELSMLDAMAHNADRRIWALAGDRIPTTEAVTVPAPIVVKTNRPGQGPGGEHVFLGGEEAIASMTTAPGMQVSLYADEISFPEMVNPVQMAWDTRGRLWVAVWPTYPHWEPGKPMNDKLLVLEDTTGDGRADTQTVFVGDLHNPTGFEFWNGGVIVANAPDLLFLKDTDGDGVADVRQRILHGLSSADTHHSANSFVLGPDGALYFQEGVFHQTQIESINGPVRNRDACAWRFDPRTWKVERYIPFGFANPHGHVFDHWGQDFITDGTGNLNYYALPFSGYLEQPEKHTGYFTFLAQRSRPAGGTEILSSPHFPDENQGSYLIANVIGFQGLFQYRIQDAGSGFGAEEMEPIVQSSDKRFRPVDMEVGPDGALYFLDWHNPLIGHMQHHLRDPSRDSAHGRVYRVTVKGKQPLTPRPIAGQPIASLLEILKSPFDRVRYRARIELSGRDSDDVAAAVGTWVAGLGSGDGDTDHHRLEGLWTLQQHNRMDAALLESVLVADDPRARAAATRVLRASFLNRTATLAALARAIQDPHPRVRLEALVALSFHGSPAAAEIALEVLGSPMDRFLDYALAETLKGLASHWGPALASGQAFAAENPAGLAHLLGGIDTNTLAGVHPGEAKFREMLSRHALDTGTYLEAATELARMEGGDAAKVLMAAIDAADQSDTGHGDHLLKGLFTALGQIDPIPVRDLARMARSGLRPSTRRLATAARIDHGEGTAALWDEAQGSIEGLRVFLESVALVRGARAREALFPLVLPVVQALPGSLANPQGEENSLRGRYVRIDLPGKQRTLTLAEVEVISNGVNIAPGSGDRNGGASQSSVAWSGHADRAIDGNTSGVFSEGGQTHTSEGSSDPWWELDLGSVEHIEEIVVWNRDEVGGRYARRLDGFVLSILNADRQRVFQAPPQTAPAHSARFGLVPPTVWARRAAIGALAALGIRTRETVQALAIAITDPDLRQTVCRALRTIPGNEWPEQERGRVAAAVAGALVGDAGRALGDTERSELIALADALLPHLRGAQESALRAARSVHEIQVIVIRPLPDTLLYDIKEFTVAAGLPVELLFENIDLMPHNLILAAPDSLATVGRAAEAMASDRDAWERAYVPTTPLVLQATGLIQPGQSGTLRFDAPSEVDDYPYLCTLPGHWVRMNGTMHVVATREEAQAASKVLSSVGDAPTVSAGLLESRPSFVKNWVMRDLGRHLKKVGDASPERGRKVLEAASCQRCHRIDGEGGMTGPDLNATVREYLSRPRIGRKDLLAQILEPSAVIPEEYATEIFYGLDGTVVAGKVVDENDKTVLVQEDPYLEKDPVEVWKEDLEERQRSMISTMPTGLLNSFEQQEILDLLAYLESLAGD